MEVYNMTKEYQAELKRIYEETIKCEEKHHLTMLEICNQYEKYPEWCIGPISLEESLTFHKPKQWKDPTGIGWTCGFLFNPSIIEYDGKLYMFYRAAPKKEALSSRIGLAIYSEKDGWTDYEENPLIYSTEDDEILGVEDPKVYALEDGRFIMYYNGVAPISDEIKESLKSEYKNGVPGVICSIKAAISNDLLHWEKIGEIVPLSISKYWAKAAVIPRDPKGFPVRINGQYLMFLSEGCGEKQYVGYSDDMINWDFKQQTYLEIGDMGSICEVACAITHYNKNDKLMLLDFFYHDHDGIQRAAQALYSIKKPFEQLEINKGGTLSWGGIIQFNGKWHYAQGWDAAENDENMFFYTAPIK